MSAGATPPPLPRKPRNWLPAIVVTGVFAPLVILLIVFISYRVSNASAIRRLEAEIKKKGEPLSLVDLAATYPPIPDEENGAVLLVELWKKEDPEFWKAFVAGVRPLPARREPGWNADLPILGTQAKHISRTTRLSTENLAAAEGFLEERKLHSGYVLQALGKPKFRFPIVITDGFNALLPHIPMVRLEAQSFHIAALLATERGDVEGAIAALENIARAGSALATEPLLISQLVRIACYDMTLSATERLLSRHSLSTQQLERIAILVNSLEMPGDLRLTLISDRAAYLSLFRLPPEGVAQALSDESMDSSVVTGILQITGLKDADRRLMLETMEKAIALADHDDAEALGKCEDLFKEVVSEAQRMPPRIFCAMLLPALQKAVPKFVSLEARRRAAIVTIAVEQFRAARNGQPPGRLDDLIPGFLPKPLADPFDGEPLRYKKLPVGFVVYSIGPDRTDDGGIEPLQRGRQKNFDVTFVVER